MFRFRALNRVGVAALRSGARQFSSVPPPSFFKRPVVRALTTVALLGVVLKVGYEWGQQSNNPNYLEEQNSRLVPALLDMDRDDSPYMIYGPHSEQFNRVDAIAGKILHAAAAVCDRELQEGHLLYEEARQNGLDLSEAKFEIEFWTTARLNISMGWKVAVSNHGTPNAFVTEFCPGIIFVYEGLLTAVKPTDDELALIIAREVTHQMLGHTVEKVPTGVLFKGLMKDLNEVRSHILSSYSEDREQSADDLGLDIANVAGYDIKTGIDVFARLAQVEGSNWDGRSRHDSLKNILADYEE